MASPSPVTCQTTRAVSSEGADVDGREGEGEVVAEEQRDQHEEREEEGGDLGDGVLDDGDGQIGAALVGEDDAGDVLDGVAGDGDDDEAGEGLGQVELFDGGREAVTNQSETKAEPPPAMRRSRRVKDSERRGWPGGALWGGEPGGDASTAAGLPGERPTPARPPAPRSRVGTQIGHDPGQVDEEQADGADHRDLLDVMAGGIVRAEGEPEEDDDEDGDEQQRGGVAGQAVGEAHDPIGAHGGRR